MSITAWHAAGAFLYFIRRSECAAMNDEFYVGYSPKAPPVLGRTMAGVACGIVVAGLAVGGLLLSGQSPFAAASFEYGEYREYSGIIEEWPYPVLRSGNGNFLLVGPGKHGLPAVRGWQARSVRLKGSLIERGGDRMLEVLPESIAEIAQAAVSPADKPISLGKVTLRGEIVDGKCYLGVMNPGSGKVHRDCAVRCISGGAPAAFAVRDAGGQPRFLLLAGKDGRALNREVLSFVGEPLEIAGELKRSGSTLVLTTEPSQFRR